MSVAAPTAPSIETIRAQFPALACDTILLENAGGSQVPGCVADAIHEYMAHTYVQLDADYELSRYCTEVVENAHSFVELFMNAGDRGKAILGPSSTALSNMLAACYREKITSEDEIIIARCGHETNIGPWIRLAEATGATVRWWEPDPGTTSTTVEGLTNLLCDNTKLVAFPHVSNLLGEIVDVKAVTTAAHDAGAQVVVDGVAYAPHRAIDVTDWDVDFYFYSTYKVYGPHMAAMFAAHNALAELTGPNHFFVPDHEVPYKFEPGGVSHEGCAGLLALGNYLQLLAGQDDQSELTRDTVRAAYDLMTALELPLQQRLIDYLKSKSAIRIIGPAHGDASRVGTISFVHESKSSREISRFINDRGIGMRYGHMYAYRLCQSLGIDLDDGVVRISLVHYNRMDEIDAVIRALEEIL